MGPTCRLTARFNDRVEAIVEGYRRSLEWVLNHQMMTLVVTAMTLAATIALYVVIPKGFLPLQDTGLITAVTEAGPEVSFAEMTRLQNLAVQAIERDEDVTGTVSVAPLCRGRPAAPSRPV